MKKGFLKRSLCGALTAMICIAGSVVPAAHAGPEQLTGTEDGYDWELWNQYGQGTANMTVGKGGTYKCDWSGIQNVLFRSGKKWNNNPQWTSLGGIAVDYEVDYRPSGNSYLCIYGWMTEPTVEYYICDSYGTWRPPGNGFQLKGTKQIDGGTYEIYEGTHTGPSIFSSNETFNQYWSIRVDGQLRTKGTITVSEHFKAWEECGIKLGGLHEVALNVEGYQSSGSAEVKKNDLLLGSSVATPDPVEPVEPDENGYYFNSTFEEGTDNWKGRGDAKAVQSGSAASSGSKSLAVSGRTDSWNGAAISLDPAAFEAGKTYAFSADAMQNTTASEDFKLTLQCNIGGEENYINVAEATGAKGEWVQLVNNSFTIPAGASSLLLYVETADSTTDFYIDNAIGALEGKIKEGNTPPVVDDYIIGDLNGDKVIDAFDVALERQAIINMFAGTKTPPPAADINSDGKVGMDDLVLLSKYVLAQIDKFPDAPVTTTTTTKTTAAPQQTTTTTAKPNTGDPTSYMDKVRASMTNNVPGSATNGSSDYGTLEKITYFSSTAGRNKNANVLLPDGYSTSEKYPVLYVNHGIFGDENSMLTGMSVRELAGNLVKSGEAEKMIIVFPQMFSSNTMTSPGGMDQATCAGYDMFLDDLTKDLMPYIEQNYSIKTGRENTAISGFSMGGRESLYIGVMRPDLFGYIGAACPAPGVTPGSDMFMSHPGNMQESEFKIKDTSNYPYLWLITGGTNDSVVGTFPKQYHEILTTNGQDHIWQEIQGGGHDASCVVPMMYNFMRNIFKAE